MGVGGGVPLAGRMSVEVGKAHISHQERFELD